MVGSLTETPPGAIIFSDEDLPLEGRDHQKALFIKAEVKGKMTCCVMVENGSVINVCPLKILPKLGLTVSDLKPFEVVIKAYDDTRRPVEGIFRSLVKTGPIEAWVDLHVIDIPVTFAILLGRPWFHPLGGVPSTLHQKIKFPLENQVVTISAETEAAIAALRLTPKEIPISPSFEVCPIYEAEMNEKVMLGMMCNMDFFPGMGLGKNQQGPPEFMEQQTLRLKHIIGYTGGDNSDEESDFWDQLEKEEVAEAKKSMLKETFIREGIGCSYMGTPELILMAGEVIPRFEIFADYVKGAKQAEVVKVPMDVEELVLAEEEPKEDTATSDVKVAGDQDEEPDLETYILNSIMDIFYDDYDVSFSVLFETDDVFYSKVNAMNSDFAYLCDVLPNGYTVCDDHFMYLFDINSMQTELFNLSTIDNPKNILLASDLTHEEREKIIETLKKRQKVFSWGYEDMLGIDREITEHRIPTHPHISPVKQKKRRLRSEWALLVKE